MGLIKPFTGGGRCCGAGGCSVGAVIEEDEKSHYRKCDH